MSTSSLRKPRVLALICFFGFIVALSIPHRYNPSYKYFRKPSRHNAVIFMLVSPSRLAQATIALRNVEERFNRRLKYPYVLFTVESEIKIEDIPEETKAKIDWITEGRATFASVPKEQWDVPDFLDKSLVDASVKNLGFSTGYRAMCRFYSGFFWRHPALATYDWLWRLDTDIEFHCDVPYDPIERVISQNALYGFVQISDDGDWIQRSLASNVSKFLSENKQLIPSDANLGFVWNRKEGIEKALLGEAGNAEWTTRCMYDNFEISHRSVWESEIYTKFFNFLDQAGGFFYERWGDAPIHSYGLAMSLRKDQVVQLKNTGYQHQGWEFDCPAKLARCTCERTGELLEFNDHIDTWFNPPM